MTVFVDASCLVAIIAGEPDADALADELQRHADRFYSAMSVWEAVTALCRSFSLGDADARAQVMRYLSAGGLTLVPIGTREMMLALDAYATYGKGRHPAALNMGDCFAYACAKANNAALLYKGQDFSRTDLA